MTGFGGRCTVVQENKLEPADHTVPCQTDHIRLAGHFALSEWLEVSRHVWPSES